MSENKKKSKKTLLSAMLLSSPGPLVTFIAVLSSTSATQIADCIRRTSELVALVAAFIIYSITKGEKNEKLERRANLIVAFAMVLSSIALIIVGIFNFINYEASGSVIMGLVIAILGLLVNAFFWARYTKLHKEENNGVIKSQITLYRAKTLVDSVVSIALLCVAIVPESELARYVDSFGSIFVSIYLFYTAIRTFKDNKIVKK